VRRDSEDTLLVQIPEKRGKDGETPSPARKERIPLLKIDEVVVLGEVTLTASAMHLLLERDVETTFLDRYGQFKGRLSPTFSKNAVLRIAQYRVHQDITQRCELARCFVIGKLSNQRQRLLRYNRPRQDAEVRKVVDQMGDLISGLSTLSLHHPPAMKPLVGGDNRVGGTPLETILGMEGAGSAAYFRCFGKLLSDKKQ
jgi:CRISP-associated protein Cas1